MKLTPGTYRHWKGKLYQLLLLAVDDETREPLVVYIPLYAVKGVQMPTVRTLKNFTQIMFREMPTGRIIRRFERIIEKKEKRKR